MIRVLLVDDHAALREPLAFMIDREADLTVVGEAGTVAEALPLVGQADVVVVDLGLPNSDGVNVIRAARAEDPPRAVLVVTASQDRTHLGRAVEAGAAGLLHKSGSMVEVIAAIRKIGTGATLLAAPEAVALLREAAERRDQAKAGAAALARLTARERQVIEGLADGLSDREIAERLCVSHETVRSHMVNLLRKLGVESRLQALIFAVRHGAIEIE